MRALAMLLLMVSALAAQQDASAAEEAARAMRSLASNRAEVDRLIELRMRHDLGLPVDESAQVFESTVEPTPIAMERMRRELREEEATTLSIRQRFEKMRKAVAQLRKEAMAAAGSDRNPGDAILVPVVGSSMSESSTQSNEAVLEAVPQPAAPAVETAPSKPEVGSVELLGLDPLRAQIHGSQDHLRVAQALFRAGQALWDRSHRERANGNGERARLFAVRGKERLDRAVEELHPLLAGEEPAFAALFCLGRCRELLFRYSERYEGLSLGKSPREYQQREQEVREAFLAITARDVNKTGVRGQVPVLGSWGQAAKTAMEHFRWMNLHAAYDASAAIDALTWPGEGAQ